MTKVEFLVELQNLLGCAHIISMDDMLEDIEEWDSLAIMAVLAWLDKKFFLTLTFNQLEELKTVREIADLSKDIV